MGVIGRNRKEVGLLVQVAFKKYNAVRQSEENNRNESYVRVSVPDPLAGGAGSVPSSSSVPVDSHGGHTSTGKLVDLDHDEGSGRGGSSSHVGH